MKPSRRPTKKIFKQFHPGGTEDLDEWRQIFVDTCDPTEYTAALQLTGSWAEWQRFKKEWPGFSGVILPEWKVEQEIKIRSDAIRSVVLDATSEKSKSAASSAKWLAEGRFDSRPVGRPDSKRVAHESKVNDQLAREIEEDIARVQESSGQTVN